jgi:hypothetical protein
MTDRVCKNCNRPLHEEDGEYCLHCTAKRAGEIGKAGGIISAIGLTLFAIASVVIKVIGDLDQNKKS